MIVKKISGERNLLKAYNMMLYFAGTMIMWDPENECIHDFWKQGMLKSLPVTSNNPRFIKAASQLRECLSDESSSFDNMKLDYISLFSNSSTQLAPPTESGFRNKYMKIPIGKSMTASEFYRSYGWQSNFKDSVSDDHIGIELLFLTLMVEKYLELDDEVCHIEMKKEIRRFIDDNLMTWIPEWNNTIQENARTVSYKGISSLILACIEDLYSLMDSSHCTQDNFHRN